MAPNDLSILLTSMQQAAHAGKGLSNISAARSARLLGLDALTLTVLTARDRLELLWYDYVDRLGPDLEDLQYTLGEGPTPDAARLRYTIVEPDLTVTPLARWPVFLPAVLRTSARAVIAVPLSLGAVRAGALTGYRVTTGPASSQQIRDIFAFAQAALALLLQFPLESVTTGVSHNGPFPLHRVEVHQATGILAVQLNLRLEQALMRLRAYAYSHERPVLDVARDVIAYRLHLDNGSGDTGL